MNAMIKILPGLMILFLFSCKPEGCPPEMVELKLKDKSFCIDRYESYIVGYDKNGKPYRYEPKFEYVVKKDGKYQPGNIFDKSTLKDRIYARSGKGMTPIDSVSFYEAEIACKNAGKRLCRKEEWNSACRGNKNQNYPYGNQYREDYCNGYEYGLAKSSISVLPSGSMEKCDNGYGVMDLSGNLWEWIDGTDPSGSLKLIKGGGFANSGYDEEILSCIKDKYQPPEIRLSGVGFRCCRSR